MSQSELARIGAVRIAGLPIGSSPAAGSEGELHRNSALQIAQHFLALPCLPVHRSLEVYWQQYHFSLFTSGEGSVLDLDRRSAD